MGKITFPVPTPREQLLGSGLGCYAETFPHILCLSPSATAASQTAHGVAIGLRAGDVVTNISMQCENVGATLSLVKYGLYSKTGTRLGVTADIKASLAAAAIVTGALTSAYTVPADDVYYCVVLAVGTTMPQFQRANATTLVAVGSAPRPHFDTAGQADLGTTIAVSSNGSRGYWFGIS